jgi:uncharacterized protein YrrD
LGAATAPPWWGLGGIAGNSTPGDRAVAMMLMRSADLIGRPVVDLSTGNDLAEIRDVIFDRGSGTLTGFTLRKRGFLGRRMKVVLALADVVSVGNDAVMVANHDALSEPDFAPAAMVTAKAADVLKDQVVTESGRVLGEVRDVIFIGGRAPKVIGFELADGPIDRGFIPLGIASAVSGSALVVPDSYEQRISADPSGLVAEVSLIDGKAP